MGYTLTEKILFEHAEVDHLAPGDVVTVRCDVVMTNDISGPMAFHTMTKMGVPRVFDPAKVVVVSDHFTPAKDVRSANLQKRLKEWSDEQGVTFYGQGRGGIEHAVLVEDGWVVPGSVIAGATRTRARTARSARSAPGLARRTSRRVSPTASSGRWCRGRSRWS